jgi:hypothetical protein
VNHPSILHLGRLIAVSAIVLPAPGYAALPSVFNADVPNDGATQPTTDASQDESFNASRHELAIAPPDLPLDTPGDDTIAQMTEQEILERLEQLEQEVEFLRQQLQSLEDTADPPVDGPVTAEGASSPPDAGSPTDAGGIAVNAEVLYLRPSINASQAFAVTQTPNDVFTIQTLDLDYEAGIRLGLDYVFPNSPWHLRFAYTTLSTTTSGNITAPPGGRAGRARSVSDPLLNLNEPVTGTNNLSFADYSLEIGYALNDTGPFRTRLFTGLRVAEINQSIFARELNSDEFSTSRSSFNGYGPYIGGAIHYDLGAGLSIFGEGSVSLLYGSVNQRLEDFDRGPTLEGFSSNVPRLTTPVLAFAAGVNWQREFSETFTVQLSAAYEAQYWSSVVQGNIVSDLTNNTLQAGRLADLTLSGFRLGLRFLFEF